MRNPELTIITTDIPQLTEIVAAKRMETLTAYPLARLCEWSAPQKRHRLGPSNGSQDDGQE